MVQASLSLVPLCYSSHLSEDQEQRRRMGDERQRMNEMLILAVVRTGQTMNQVLTARFISPQWIK